MNRNPPTKAQGLEMARMLKMLLRRHGFPVRDVLLFGSVAKDSPHPWSDIDIAVIHEPFGPSRAEELRAMCGAEEGTELRNIEVLYFHPDDLEDKYSTIAREVKRYGIAV